MAAWQISQAVSFGVMFGMQNTYDEARSIGSVNAWNAFLHLAALAATERMAAFVGDAEMASNASAWLTRGRNATTALLWDATAGHFRGFWCERGKITANAMADSLYGVLWAAVLDLDLGLDRSLYIRHQASVWERAATPWGIKFWTNKTTDYECEPLPGDQAHDLLTDDTLWAAHAVECASGPTLCPCSTRAHLVPMQRQAPPRAHAVPGPTPCPCSTRAHLVPMQCQTPPRAHAAPGPTPCPCSARPHLVPMRRKEH